jgi:predicted O-methyltransferase YrrM
MNALVQKAMATGSTEIDFGEVSLTVLSNQSLPEDFVEGPGRVYIAKSWPYIESYLTVAQGKNIKSVLELGIYKGGSVVFFDQMLDLERLTAVDIMTQRLPNLDSYVADISKSKVSLHYGIDQSDKAKLKDIISADFPEGVDLVIDDASHWYSHTKASFEVIFPKLTENGVYVVEDWDWGRNTTACGDSNTDCRQLYDELLAIKEAFPDIISGFHSYPGFFALTRGPAQIPDDFTIAPLLAARV